MNAIPSKINRPKRWDEPLDPNMSHEFASELLNIEPLASIDPDAFSKGIPLLGIIENDCRILDLKKGDFIVREGDYGSSAFLILFGEALVSLQSLPETVLGRQPSKKKGWGATIAQLWQNSKGVETRDYSAKKNPGNDSPELGSREDETGTRVFLHDIPRVIPANKSVSLKEGEIFGEISALTRTPRSATVVANSAMRVLEIRWQGFRELLKRHDAMRTHVDRLYRENSLRSHLRELGSFQASSARGN